LVGDNDNMETCVDTLRDEEFYSDEDLDNPYPSVNFDRAGASIVEDEREGRSLNKKRDVKKSDSKRKPRDTLNLPKFLECRWKKVGGGNSAAEHGADASC